MGRTNATYRDTLRGIESEWSEFQRALRREDQQHFDRLFEHARRYADAAGHQNPTDPMPAVLLSMVLAQERERERLAERVAELEERIE
ncbi:hypothetical protein [Salinarchaeum laminariae]|uniref:hypothetical protein n=1 Tax=Salinarchaeum laminariae TaxID=869888 RepID=UPI0020C15840|nr:hypothetical protein [Salinarchaeum laminariae]